MKDLNAHINLMETTLERLKQLTTENFETNEDALCNIIHAASELETNSEYLQSHLYRNHLLKKFPNSAMNWHLYSSFVFWRSFPNEIALSAAVRAFELSVKNREFMALMGCDLCRMCIRLSKFQLLIETLEKIIEVYDPSSKNDIRVEKEFIKMIPEGKVSSDIIDRFNAL